MTNCTSIEAAETGIKFVSGGGEKDVTAEVLVFYHLEEKRMEVACCCQE